MKGQNSKENCSLSYC